MFTDAVAGYSIEYPEGWRAGSRPEGDVPREEQHRADHRRRGSLPSAAAIQSEVAAVPGARIESSQPVTVAGSPPHKVVYSTPERPERGHREAGHARHRPLLPGACRQGGDRRSRHAARSRPRRPADDRELPVAVTSLYREPETAQPEIAWPGLEADDVFKLYGRRWVETVAFAGSISGSSGQRSWRCSAPRVPARDLPAARGRHGSALGRRRSRVGDLVGRLGEAGLAAYRAREVAVGFPERQPVADLSAEENSPYPCAWPASPQRGARRRGARRVRPRAPPRRPTCGPLRRRAAARRHRRGRGPACAARPRRQADGRARCGERGGRARRSAPATRRRRLDGGHNYPLVASRLRGRSRDRAPRRSGRLVAPGRSTGGSGGVQTWPPMIVRWKVSGRQATWPGTAPCRTVHRWRPAGA